MLGEGERALDLYQKMLQEGSRPNKVTYSCILKACSCIGAIAQGRLIHNEIIASGLEVDVIVGNTIIDMYVKCGSLYEGRSIFDVFQNRNLVSWGAMIAGYAQRGDGCNSLELFEELQRENMKPNEYIYSGTLKGCSSIGAIGKGWMIHVKLIYCGLESDLIVGSSLVDMYCKCGSLEDAYRVFKLLPNQNVVCWGAIISGYVEHGHGLAALKLFMEMQELSVKPNKVIFLCILQACGNIRASGPGRLIHCQITKSDIPDDLAIGSTLVEMYARCGNLDEACKVFHEMVNPNSISWGALIAAYTQCGNCILARQCLEDMQQQGLQPSDLVFTSILSACSHVGLLDKGCQYFNYMTESYGIIPSIQHYNCMVDLLGRIGHLKESQYLLQTMPVLPDIIGWTSLLVNSRTYGNAMLGKLCFEQLTRLDPVHGSSYVLMSNMYADAHLFDDVKNRSLVDRHVLMYENSKKF